MTEKKTLTGRIEAEPCPYCGYKLNAFTCLSDEATPQPGDFTVCINCASVLEWDENMHYKISSLIKVPTDIRFSFVKLVNSVKELHKERET